jgi:hypothetical protein
MQKNQYLVIDRLLYLHLKWGEVTAEFFSFMISLKLEGPNEVFAFVRIRQKTDWSVFSGLFPTAISFLFLLENRSQIANIPAHTSVSIIESICVFILLSFMDSPRLSFSALPISSYHLPAPFSSR